MIHYLLSAYGWGFFLSFFYFVYEAGVLHEELDAIDPGFLPQALAVFILTMFWFIVIPYHLGCAAVRRLS